MLKHVLVPLDGSALAEKALDFAQRMLAPGSKLTLLATLEGGASFPAPGQDAAGRSAEEQAKLYLEHEAKNLKLKGFEADTVVGKGDPAALIVDRALRLGVEAIVMATQERSDLGRLLFGSVTRAVLNDTPCPVVIVPNREQQRVEDEALTTDADLGFDTLAPE